MFLLGKSCAAAPIARTLVAQATTNKARSMTLLRVDPVLRCIRTELAAMVNRLRPGASRVVPAALIPLGEALNGWRRRAATPAARDASRCWRSTTDRWHTDP